jgi:DNA polymerase III subunit chi
MILLENMKNSINEVSFYRLNSLPIIKAAPKLIEKIYYSKQRLLVVVENEEMLQNIDNVLWSYSTKHFIAHATLNDPHPEDQPVYLTSKKDDNANSSTIVMALGMVNLDEVKAGKYCYMFDGNDEEQQKFARSKWKQYKNQDCKIIYWQQSDDGSWEKQG